MCGGREGGDKKTFTRLWLRPNCIGRRESGEGGGGVHRK